MLVSSLLCPRMKTVSMTGWKIAKCLLYLMVTIIGYIKLKRRAEFHLNKSPLTEPNSIIVFV